MPTVEPYGEQVRTCFENPVHAGDLEDNYARIVAADVSESRDGARLVLCAGLNDGKIAALRFRARGCPHLIAAAEWVCSQLEGRNLRELAAVSANELSERLSVPVGKLGRMLLVEDAARQLLESSGESPSGK